MVERRSPKPNVIGSNPIGPAKLYKVKDKSDHMANNSNSKSVKEGIKQYFNEAQDELRKVSWPTREKVIRSSSIIIVMVIFFSAYITGLDLVISKVISWITSYRY